MLEEKDVFVKIYSIYKSKRLLLALVAAIIFVVMSIIINMHPIQEDSTDYRILYYLFVAVQNISITMFSIFVLDYFINISYKEQLDEDIAKILTNPLLMKDFIKKEKSKDILHNSMETILGSRVSEKIEETILNKYDVLPNNCYRKDIYMDYVLFECDEHPNFYKAEVTVDFEVFGINDCDFEIFYTEIRKDFDVYVKSLSGLKRVVTFPFLLDAGLDNINVSNRFKVNYFRVNGNDVENNKKDDNNCYSFSINNDSQDKVNIEFSFETYINKTENYIFEDVICLYDGFHMSLDYDRTKINKCNCYSSYKTNTLKIKKGSKQINIHLNDIVLPDNFFIIIWNDRDEVLNEISEEQLVLSENRE